METNVKNLRRKQDALKLEFERIMNQKISECSTDIDYQFTLLRKDLADKAHKSLLDVVVNVQQKVCNSRRAT